MPIGVKLMNAFAGSSNHFRNDACDVSGPQLIQADHLSKSLTRAESILTPGPIVVEIAIPFR